jgi:DNA ligase-associated metallophosphoesterase
MSQGSVSVEVAGQTFQLHPFKAIFWQEQSSLLIADVHLGKTRHFRREGFWVPQSAGDQNYDKLMSLLLDLRPKRVIFLGDLFHSDYNQEWEALTDITKGFTEVQFDLVRGNHDRLSDHAYAKADIEVYEKPLLLDNILLSHEPLPDYLNESYNLAGHLHPAVRLRGRGRQSMRLPCFYFGESQGILPAFGNFTGMADLSIREGDRVFVVGEDQVIAVE